MLRDCHLCHRHQPLRVFNRLMMHCRLNFDWWPFPTNFAGAQYSWYTRCSSANYWAAEVDYFLGAVKYEKVLCETLRQSATIINHLCVCCSPLQYRMMGQCITHLYLISYIHINLWTYRSIIVIAALRTEIQLILVRST